MENYVTLEPSHPEFLNHLTGRFSPDHIALPVSSMNINSTHEKVTFRILHKSAVKRPSWARVLARIFRLDLLTLTLTPPLVVMTAAHAPWSATNLLATLSLLLLHGAVYCRNDYIDHMRGVDRLHEKGGSQVIQKGWLSASFVQKMYRALLTAALLLATPIFVSHPEVFALALAVALTGVIGYSHLRWGQWHWSLGALAVFFCLGPFLTLGMSWALGFSAIAPFIVVGIYFGVVALLTVEVRHSICLIVDDTAGLTTLPVRIGFDRTKKVLNFLLLCAALLLGLSLISLGVPPWLGLSALPFWIWMFLLGKRISRVTSPLSSNLYELPAHILRLHLWSGLYLSLIQIL